MDKTSFAKAVSTLTQPPIITIPLFLIICVILSYDGGAFNLDKFIVLEAISLVFTSILPIAIIVLWAKRIGTDHDISNRQDRFIPLIIGIICYFIGFLTCIALNADIFLTLILLCYSINTGVVLLITLKWKISVHTTGISGPIAALILLTGPIGALLGVIYPLVIWSRVFLKKHTLAQAICGGVQGFFLAAIEIYLFMYIFNIQIRGLVSLEMSCMCILAIIATPAVLGVLSYSNINKKRAAFMIAEIVMLLLFVAFTPLDVVIVFAVITIASILISHFAGPEFVWNEIIA